jgi:hypothetical protein
MTIVIATKKTESVWPKAVPISRKIFVICGQENQLAFVIDIQNEGKEVQTDIFGPYVTRYTIY